MLKDALAVKAGDCRLSKATVDRTSVAATYTCPAGSVVVHIGHPTAVESPTSKTERFGIRAEGKAPPDFIQALSKALEGMGSKWTWVESTGHVQVGDEERGPLPTDQPAGTEAGPDDPEGVGSGDGREAAPKNPEATAAGEGHEAHEGVELKQEPLTPEQEEKRVQALELYREGDVNDAYAILADLAREAPRHGVLGLLGATIAGQNLKENTVAEFGRVADASPDDPVPQFVAAIAYHYHGHNLWGEKAEKAPFYEKSIGYLDRIKEVYSAEPRVFIYLAVSHFRLGHQEIAEQYIEKAVKLGGHDPDARYCRAEIYQKTKIKQSLVDLDYYLSETKKLKSQGAVVAENKTNRVRRMREYLQAVADGEVEPTEIFDPATDRFDSWRDRIPGAPPRWLRLTKEFAIPLMGGVAVLVILGLLMARWWRARQTN